MITETHLATAIDAIPLDSTVMDAYAKEVLADVQILARILKYTVSELQELSIDEIISLLDPTQIKISQTPVAPGLTNLGKIEGLATENIILGEGTIYFDIRFSIYYKEKALKILINVEAQKSTTFSALKYHLENRIIYYLARMISSQKNVKFFNDNYDDIKKVYSIWICMDSKPGSDSIDEFLFSQRTPHGIPREFPYLDKMHGIVISIQPNMPSEESKNTLISMLEDLLTNIPATDKKRILSDKYGIKMTTTLERSIGKMCNISEFFIEQATEIGLERGMERGMKRGMEQGLEQGLEQGIRALVYLPPPLTLRDFDHTNELIINKLVEKFHLSEEDAMKYL